MSARSRHPKVSRTWRETSFNRRMSVRMWKARVRRADRAGRHDEAPRFRGTQGWISW